MHGAKVAAGFLVEFAHGVFKVGFALLPSATGDGPLANERLLGAYPNEDAAFFYKSYSCTFVRKTHGKQSLSTQAAAVVCVETFEIVLFEGLEAVLFNGLAHLDHEVVEICEVVLGCKHSSKHLVALEHVAHVGA